LIQTRPEHDFTLNVDEWERVVISNASYYTVIRRAGPGRYDRREFSALWEAVREAGADLALSYTL
jgi:hypothetical protein